MRNTFKNNWMFIIILFVTLVLPFRVEAKQTNTFIEYYNFNNEELISGDTIHIVNASAYIPVDEQNDVLFYEDKITNFEYYIIDSIDSKGNIKYKKYDFSGSNKSIWYPDSSTLYDYSGRPYDNWNADTTDDYNFCKSGRKFFGFSYYPPMGDCNIVLPSINGKISRWRVDDVSYGDITDIDVCSFKDINTGYTEYSSSCDKTVDGFENTYVGTYEYYTSYTYKFYELPEENPKAIISCDSNKLGAGESTKCKINFSYKYALSNILFDITSDKLKISNLQFDDYWEYYSDYWDSKEIDNGYSINFTYINSSGCDYPYYCGNPGGFKYLFDFSFSENPVVATFNVTSDENIDDIVSSLKTINFKYVDKTGETTMPDDKTDSNDKISNILNPSTFRNNCYLIIGIIIICGISFIQLKNKKKSK